MRRAGNEAETPEAEQTPDADDSRKGGSLRRTMVRAVFVALLLFGMMVGGLAIAARSCGSQPDLELEYEGFD